MTATILMIFIALMILALLVAVVVMRMKMKHKPPTDYYNLFIMGIIWMAFGAVMFSAGENTPSFFFILGLVFAIAGISHKKDWKKNRRTWDKLSKTEQKFKMWVIGILAVLVLIGLVVFAIYPGI